MKTRKHLPKAIMAAILLIPIAASCAANAPEDQPHAQQKLADNENADEGEGVEPEVAEALADDDSKLQPPEIPDEIYENTLEGAEAAARYLFRAIEYGYASLDIEPLEEICLEKSRTCADHRNMITNLKETNKVRHGGALRDEPASEILEVVGGVIIHIPVTQEKWTVYDETGKEINGGEEGVATMVLLTELDDDMWKIAAVSVE